MRAPEPTFTCATCDVTIVGHPTFHLGLAFCCAGCAADGPCMCSYDLEDPHGDAHPGSTRGIETDVATGARAGAAVADDERGLVGAGR